MLCLPSTVSVVPHSGSAPRLTGMRSWICAAMVLDPVITMVQFVTSRSLFHFHRPAKVKGRRSARQRR